jgi:hypothetical protein
MDDISKKINIYGTNNRYKMKQIMNEDKTEKEAKKRLQSEKWTFSEEEFEYAKQIKMIREIYNNNYIFFDDISKIAVQEINKKCMVINNKIH